MGKKLIETLVILYQCSSKIKDKFQMLGISVYHGYDDDSLESYNYSLRDGIIDISKIGELAYLGKEYNLNIRFRQVEGGDIEAFLSDEDRNSLKQGMASFDLKATRDGIANNPDLILECLPKTDLVKTYVGGVKEIISKWCKGEAHAKFKESYKEIDSMIAGQYAEAKNIPFVELYSDTDSDAVDNEEIERQKRLEEQKRRDLEKYGDYPITMELVLNATAVKGLPDFNKINEFNGTEDIRSLREWTSKCKLCLVKYFGEDMKYVVDGEILSSESKVIVNYDGIEIPCNDLDLLRKLDSRNSELEKKLKELEEEEQKRIEEEKRRIEEEKRLEEERRIEEEKRLEEERRLEEEKRLEANSAVEVESVEVESLPANLAVSGESIQEELDRREKELKEKLANYEMITQSYGDPSLWKTDFDESRKSLDALNEESDYIIVMCKSSYSSNPVITGLLKREQVVVPSFDDEDNDGDVNYEFAYESYDEFELLSSGISTLSNLGVKFNVELIVVPSKFTLDYSVTPLLEICSTSKDIPSNIAVIFIDDERRNITKERVATELGNPDLFELNSNNITTETLDVTQHSTICRQIETLCLATTLEERLNMRVFHFSDSVIQYIGDNPQADSIIGDYIKEQSEKYFDFNTANKRRDGVSTPIDSNYIVPQMNCDDIYFSLIKSYSECKVAQPSAESDFVIAQVPNLKMLIPGVSVDYPYFNSKYYSDNFKVEKEYYKIKGRSPEEIDEIIEKHQLSVEGSVSNSLEPIKEWEKPFLAYLENVIKCELIDTYDVHTKVELDELIKNGTRAVKIDKVLEEWCRGAYVLNYMHTDFASEDEIIVALGYNKDGVDPSKYCEYKVIKVGSDRNISLKTDWDEKARETGGSKKINGFYALKQYVEENHSTFIWANVLIRLLRWGSCKQEFLKLDDNVFNFKNAKVVEEYSEVSVRSLTERPLELNQILVGRYQIKSLDAKDLGTKYSKYLKGSIIGSRPQNFKNSYASLMISLGRNNEDTWEQVFVDTLTFVKSLYENGKVEIKGVDGEWSLNECKAVTFDEVKGRISVDTEALGIYDEQTGTVSPRVQVRNEQTLGADIKEYERINKHGLETYVGATDNVIISDIPVDATSIMHKMQIRTLDKECYTDAEKVISVNSNADIDSIILPFEVFTKFCFIDNFIARTDRAVKDMSEKWAMPYVIADYLYNICLGGYMENRYEMPIADSSRPFNLEVYWNCVLYGYQYCFHGKSMDERTFCQEVLKKDGVLSWTESNNLKETSFFKEDPVSIKLKALVDSTIKAGGQISPVVHFEVQLGNDSKFSNNQLLCLKGANNFYFVFVEGEYSNVVLVEKGGIVPKIDLSDDKQSAFFKKLSQADKIGYSSPELKAEIEKVL